MSAADAEEVAAVLTGDTNRFETIVKRYEKPLLHYAMRFTNDRTTAEELAHDALVAAFRSLRSWRGDSQFSTWLFALALNVYRSALRRTRPPHVPLSDELVVDGSLEAQASEDQQAAMVRRAVSFLPDKYRDALVTFYFRDTDLAETAAILGIPPGTVKARLHRGREMLRSRLERIR